MTRHRVIFATRRPPFPLDNGARIRTHRLAAGLAERFEVTLVTFADGPTYDDTRCSREDLERVLPGVRIELVTYGRPHPRGPRREVMRRGSSSFSRYATPSLRRGLSTQVEQQPDALLHLDDPGVALAGVALPAALRVFAPHNVEYRIVGGMAKRWPPTHRPFWELEWRKMRAEERRLWRTSDLCLAVSEVDAAIMRSGGARRVEICPNGADPITAPAPAPFVPGRPLRLLFVGTVDFWPYEFGVAWLIREVLPRVRQRGDVAFDVVGAPPPAPVAAEGVTYHGRVADVDPYYERAHALVIPVFEGSGTRLKAIEAAVMGRPIVSTRLGVEGLPLREGVHYLAADTPDEFARALSWLREALADSTGELEAMTRRAREAVGPYLWPRIVRDLADLYEKELTVTSGRRRALPAASRPDESS